MEENKIKNGNPIIDGFYADPEIACFNGRFYIYPTTDGGVGWNSTLFHAFSSEDLVNWRDEGVIFELKDAVWTKGVYAWAPAIAEKNGKYYLYFSGEMKDDTRKSIGVAVCDTPAGKFKDSGAPLIDKNVTGVGEHMIDPSILTDDDGKIYIYWGNTDLMVCELNEDMISLKGEIKKITPPHFREAAYVIKRNGIYHFMWSENDTGEPTYEVHYGTAKSPWGPIEGDTVILSMNNTNDSRIRGTGHHSVLNIPGTDEWYICYHRVNLERYGHITSRNSAAGNHREVCIDRLYFDENGYIMPVKATLEGIQEPIRLGSSLT
ncbi:MAG: family 43 glycosylhydrolase [Candidatus Ornithomonoglobus sp.]